MKMDYGCIYALTTKDFELSTKVGFTTNPLERFLSYVTYFRHPVQLLVLWRITFVPLRFQHLTEYDKALLQELIVNPRPDLRHVYYGSCTELVEGNHNTIAQVFIELGFKLELCDISSFQKAVKEREEEKALAMRQAIAQATQSHQEKTWFERPYQATAITQCCDLLRANRRVYLELATGGGKSYIVYNVFARLNIGLVVAFSPRKVVNLQNAHSKYTNILGVHCNVLNLSDTSANERIVTHFLSKAGPKVLLACTQSAEKVWEMLIQNNVTNIAIWFDEAHWGVEEWNVQRQLLEDNTYISYRVFTSASPNKEVVTQKPTTFGTLYKPISVSELIDNGWLCPIKAYVFSEPKVNADVAFFMLEHFSKYERTKGFSFHHTQLSAYNMFIVHVQRYLEGSTNILPYLLVDDTFQIPEGTPNIAYAYRSQIAFEQGDKAIAYVVARFSMGYDFKDIDFICFSDPKVSSKDIIQSIGRGTRPDCLGEAGRNKNKHLDVLLPVYALDDGLQKYERIKQVLLYLLQEVALAYNEIVFVERKKYEKREQQVDDQQRRIGIEEVQSALLELLRETNQNGMTLKKLVNTLKRHDVHNIKKYHEVKDAFPELALPDNPFVAFKDFTWLDTFGDNCPYYDKQTFILKMKSILTDDVVEVLEAMEDDEEKADYLHSLDNRFPNQSHWRFYGGEKNSYIC